MVAGGGRETAERGRSPHPLSDKSVYTEARERCLSFLLSRTCHFTDRGGGGLKTRVCTPRSWC